MSVVDISSTDILAEISTAIARERETERHLIWTDTHGSIAAGQRIKGLEKARRIIRKAMKQGV